jgi:hypothetical protein
MVTLRLTLAATLLQLTSFVAAHGGDGHASMDMDMGNMNNGTVTVPDSSLPSYAGLSAHSGLMLAHIALMVAAWMFVLPVGRSRLALLVTH